MSLSSTNFGLSFVCICDAASFFRHHQLQKQSRVPRLMARHHVPRLGFQFDPMLSLGILG